MILRSEKLEDYNEIACLNYRSFSNWHPIKMHQHESEMVALAKSKGAKGITLAGMCCTANEILMRHGIPIAGNFLQQEMAIITCAVDAMVVDVQCIMQS